MTTLNYCVRMSYVEAKAQRDMLKREVDLASAALRVFPRGKMGLTPDAVKATPEYRASKSRYQEAFARLRAFNAVFVKTFAKEIRADRRR